jgi:hypothetical protein
MGVMDQLFPIRFPYFKIPVGIDVGMKSNMVTPGADHGDQFAKERMGKPVMLQSIFPFRTHEEEV